MRSRVVPPVEDAGTCNAVQHAADLVGQRWAAAILNAALHGARRFTEYRAAVTGISDKVKERVLFTVLLILNIVVYAGWLRA